MYTYSNRVVIKTIVCGSSAYTFCAVSNVRRNAFENEMPHVEYVFVHKITVPIYTAMQRIECRHALQSGIVQKRPKVAHPKIKKWSNQVSNLSY